MSDHPAGRDEREWPVRESDGRIFDWTGTEQPQHAHFVVVPKAALEAERARADEAVQENERLRREIDRANINLGRIIMGDPETLKRLGELMTVCEDSGIKGLVGLQEERGSGA